MQLVIADFILEFPDGTPVKCYRPVDLGAASRPVEPPAPAPSASDGFAAAIEAFKPTKPAWVPLHEAAGLLLTHNRVPQGPLGPAQPTPFDAGECPVPSRYALSRAGDFYLDYMASIWSVLRSGGWWTPMKAAIAAGRYADIYVDASGNPHPSQNKLRWGHIMGSMAEAGHLIRVNDSKTGSNRGARYAVRAWAEAHPYDGRVGPESLK